MQVETVKEKKVFKVCKYCSEYERKNARIGQCLLSDKVVYNHWKCLKWKKNS